MAEGQVYWVPLVNIQVTTDADQDIWEMSAVTNKFDLLGFELTSEKVAAENIDLRLVRRSTSGNGGTAVEVKANKLSPAPTTVIETLALVPGTIGDIIAGYKWEQLGPLVGLPTPKMQLTIDAGDFLCLNLQSALAATTGWSGWICWVEN